MSQDRRRLSPCFGLVASIAFLGCGEADRYVCRCDYLSDTDQATSQSHAVCATSSAEAVRAGMACVGPGTVEKCSCEKAAGTCARSCDSPH